MKTTGFLKDRLWGVRDSARLWQCLLTACFLLGLAGKLAVAAADAIAAPAPFAVAIVPVGDTNLTAPDTSLELTAVVVGKPNGISFRWCKESGLGEVKFSDTTGASTTASFDIAGDYVLSLTATRGNSSAQDSIAVTVNLNPNGDFQPNAILKLVNDTDPAAHTNAFLTFGLFSSNVTDSNTAAAYYQTIDPHDRKTNFRDWLSENGMITTDGTLRGDVADARYFNAVDLGFGRRMLMSRDRRAFSVTNYKTVDEAVNDVNRIASVTMEYAPPDDDPAGAPFTKFYIFDGKTGDRLLAADLDGGGAKNLPGLCIVCHGGVNAGNVALGQPYRNSGNVRAHFLPFDLNALHYSCDRKFTRAAQEGVFHKLNQGVLEIEDGTSTSPANLDSNNQLMATLNILIEGWYGTNFVVPAPLELPSHTQNSEFVPDAWSTRAELYANVVARSCRNCHSTRPSSSLFPLAFGSSADFDHFSATTRFFVFGASNLATPPITTLQVPGIIMPHARKTFQRFWLSTTPAQPEILRDYLSSLGVP